MSQQTPDVTGDRVKPPAPPTADPDGRKARKQEIANYVKEILVPDLKRSGVRVDGMVGEVGVEIKPARIHEITGQPTTEASELFIVRLSDGTKIEFSYVDSHLQQGEMLPGSAWPKEIQGKKTEIVEDGAGNKYYYDADAQDYKPFGVSRTDAEGRTVAERDAARRADRQAATDEGRLRETERSNRAQETAAEQRLRLDEERNTLTRGQLSGYTDDGLPTMDRERLEFDQDRTTFDQTVKFPWDVAREMAAAKRDELRIQIQSGQLTLEQSKQQWEEWKTQNIDVPFRQSQEARLNASEARLRQQAEDEAAKAKADIAVRRGTLAQSARETASANARALLPYSVGPSFAGQFAQGVNALARGGPGSEVNFSADAFTFQAPDFDKLAERAAAQALRGVSPYARSIVDPSWNSMALPSVPQVDFSGRVPLNIPLPDFSAMGSAGQNMQDVYTQITGRES